MLRKSSAALFLSASVMALTWATDGNARGGGGHFGGGFGGGHFGGGERFGGERFGGERFREAPREMHREDVPREEGHRDGGEHRDAERHRDDADAHRGEDHRENADRDERRDGDHRGDDHRDLANRDWNHPINDIHNANWNHNNFWNNNWGGHNWNCNGCRWGWAGGVFWPFAMGDLFSFAWWPYAGVPSFWNYGVDPILTGLFWPYGVYQWPTGYGAYAYSGGSGDYQYARESHQDVYSASPDQEQQEKAEANSASQNDFAQSCAGFAPGVNGLPVDKIAQTVKPAGKQLTAFDQLKAASSKANSIMQAACPSEAPLTPIGRLDVLQKRLSALDQAVDTVMTPLTNFTNVLSDDQRRALDGMGGNSDKTAAAAGLASCSDAGQSFADVPVQQIEQSVQPNDQQKAALDHLKTVAAHASDQLRAQCPSSIPETAEGRLQAMDKRVHDTIAAVDDVRPALQKFYDSLSDEQKARFNTLPPETTAKN